MEITLQKMLSRKSKCAYVMLLVGLEAIPFDQILIKLSPLSTVFSRIKVDLWSSAKFLNHYWSKSLVFKIPTVPEAIVKSHEHLHSVTVQVLPLPGESHH